MDWKIFHELSGIKKIERVGPDLTPAKARFKLPEPLELEMPLSQAIKRRRSRRSLGSEPLTQEELSTLLFSGGGITGERNGTPLKAAPSAGACHPTKVMVVVYHVDGLDKGLYRYDAREHSLWLIAQGDVWRELTLACLGQDFVGDCSCVICLSSNVSKTVAKYGQRGYRYALMDAAAMAENISLAVEALGYGSVWVGAFDDTAVQEILLLREDEVPLLLLPVGPVRK